MFGNFGGFDLIEIALRLPAVLIAMTFHEYAHAYMAVHFGDYSPKFRGRLTLWPPAHIDLIGFLAFCILGFGWAKPVEVDYRSLQGGKRSRIIVALAGVCANLLVALVASVLLNITDSLVTNNVMYYIYQILYEIMYLNVLFAMFNILPVPPMDGYKVLYEKCYFKNPRFFMNYERWGRYVLLGLALVGILGVIIGYPTSFICSLFMKLTSFL